MRFLLDSGKYFSTYILPMASPSKPLTADTLRFQRGRSWLTPLSTELNLKAAARNSSLRVLVPLEMTRDSA